MRKALAVAITLFFLTGLTSPAQADCCDDVLSCAATVVTDGLSCAVQQLISTVTNLINMLRNVGNMLSGTTGSAISDARKSVDEAIDAIAMQSQNNAEALALSERKASQLASQEALTRADEKSVARSGGSSSASGSPSAHSTVRHSSGAAAIEAPPGTYHDLFERALKQVRQVKAEGDPDVPKINPYLAAARQSESAGLRSASDIANRAILAPVNQWIDALNSMVANPLHIFDPTSAVDDMTSSVMSNLDVNLSQMVDSITSGPNQQFQAVAPVASHLQSKATEAEEISAAMENVYRVRTQSAAEALMRLLPNTSVSGPNDVSARTSPKGGIGSILSSFSTRRQASLVAPRRQFQQIAAAMAQLRNLRTQAKAVHASLATYKTKLTQKLNSALTGKTPSEVAAQGDALIAQARTRFANDPKTRDAVINLLNSEIRARPLTHKP